MIHAVAVVGRANNPLYIQTFGVDGEGLRFHYIVHTALDIVEERGGAGAGLDMYLGLLYPTQNFKVYGYITNTKAKFFVVLDEGDNRETEVKGFFRKFHSLYVDTICNPFYKPESKILSKGFDDEIQFLVKKLNEVQ